MQLSTVLRKPKCHGSIIRQIFILCRLVSPLYETLQLFWTIPVMSALHKRCVYLGRPPKTLSNKWKADGWTHESRLRHWVYATKEKVFSRSGCHIPRRV